MLRRIIKIDRERCNGCGLCATACHEGAIEIKDGKAQLLREDYCDGLGDCLPACPENAISFEEREAAAYDEAAVKANMARSAKQAPHSEAVSCCSAALPASELRQWPVQMKLAPTKATYFDGASLLVAADCTAFAYAAFHERFIKNHVTLIGCPKLDAIDYSVKLGEILRQNEIESVTVVRMEVPCCGGLTNAVTRAISESGKTPPCHVVTISLDGQIVEEKSV